MLKTKNLDPLGDEQAVFLMAEDNPADAELFKEMIERACSGNYRVHCVDRYEKIFDALKHDYFDALILDMNLPGHSGSDNVSSIVRKYPTLPIVILTGQEDINIAVASLKNGAQDYLFKNNVSPDILSRSLRYAQERKHIELQLREALADAAYQNSRLENLAKYDSLTGLPNRTYFLEVADRILYRAQRQDKMCALFYFDLNDFKKINDTYGHIIGDELLKQVSERLASIVRQTDVLARMGGDEFVLLTDLLEAKEEIYSVVSRISKQFEEVFVLDHIETSVIPSVGVAFYPEASNLDELIRHADCAMYEAKSSHNLNTCFYTIEMARKFSRRQKIETELPNGLNNCEFQTWFQPIFSVREPDDVYMEALLRWHSRALDWVEPNEFIPVAELNPAINAMTKFTVAQCSKLLSELKDCAFVIDRVAINICVMQISSDHFSQLFLKWLREYNLPPESVCLELTERQIVQNATACAKNIDKLKNTGIKFALDDFGSGYSSVSHLLDLPFDTLKLDKKLIDNIDNNIRNQALAAGIVEMAHRMEMTVVAEGIESHEEHQCVLDLGCDYIQGFRYSKPTIANQILSFYSTQ